MKIGFLNNQSFGKITKHAWLTHTNTSKSSPNDYNLVREQSKNQKYHVHYNDKIEKYQVCTAKEEKDIQVNEHGDTVLITKFVPVLKDSELLSGKDIYEVAKMATEYENAHYFPNIDSDNILI